MEREDSKFEVCSCTVIHEDVVEKVRKSMIEDRYVSDLAELFKVFGDGTRIKIISALFKAEMCVCDIAVLLGMNQSAISHQLKTLKQARLIKNRRDGKIVYYSLDDEHIKEIFDKGLIHVREY
jgi:ArsR family transcriptional regulator